MAGINRPGAGRHGPAVPDATNTIALHSTLPAPAANGDVPEWVHLVPAGEFRGEDGRGPFHLADPAAVIAASLPQGARLVVDETHATDHGLRTGLAAPAKGWIVEMQARDDGIWGRVEWTPGGRRLLRNREYRGLSPVVQHHAKTGVVSRVLRAALTNAPNLTLTSLHSTEPGMDLITQLRQAFGLAETADEAAVVAAATAARTAISAHATELGRVAVAAGVAANADVGAIVTALGARTTNTGLQEVIALQARISELEGAQRRATAETVIDRAIAEGRAVPPTRREELIAMHAKDPASVTALLSMLPPLNAGGLGGRTPVPPASIGAGARSASDNDVIALMGIDPAAFDKARALQGEGAV